MSTFEYQSIIQILQPAVQEHQRPQQVSSQPDRMASESDSKEHENNITKKSLLKLHSQRTSKGIHNDDNISQIVAIFGGIDKVISHCLKSENVNLDENQLKQLHYILQSARDRYSSRPVIDTFNKNSFSELSNVSQRTLYIVYGYVRQFESICNIPETITILFILFYAMRFKNKIDAKLKSFSDIGVLGVGSFSRVSLVKDPKTNKTYALKKLSKHKIIETGQQIHIQNELNVLAQLDSEFTIKLYATYKDKFNVYFLLEPVLGGELFTVLRWNKRFSEKTARFYGACIVLAFEMLHSNNIIYRHLKPENIIIDKDGYCKLIDFGFSKEINSTCTLCGDGFNLCPEVIQSNFQLTVAVDWWQFGIFLFEMITGNPPFEDDENMKMYEKILTVEVEFPDEEIQITDRGKDLMKQLLKKDPSKRLGYKGVHEIFAHCWFSGFDWNKMRQKEMTPPYVPNITSCDDVSHFDTYPEDNNVEELIDDPTMYEWCNVF